MFDSVTDVAAKCALLWIVGEFGAQIPEAPYLLEPLVEDYFELESDIKLELLTGLVKLFFQRPGECQKMLGDLFYKAIQDSAQAQVGFFCGLVLSGLSSLGRCMLYHRDPLCHDSGT